MKITTLILTTLISTPSFAAGAVSFENKTCEAAIGELSRATTQIAAQIGTIDAWIKQFEATPLTTPEQIKQRDTMIATHRATIESLNNLLAEGNVAAREVCIKAEATMVIADKTQNCLKVFDAKIGAEYSYGLQISTISMSLEEAGKTIAEINDHPQINSIKTMLAKFNDKFSASCVQIGKVLRDSNH